MQTVPLSIQRLVSLFQRVESRIGGIVAVQTAVHDLDAFKGQGQMLEDDRNDVTGWRNVVEAYEKAIGKLNVLDAAEEEGRRYIPEDLNLKKERKFVEKRLTVARQKLARAEEEAGHREVYLQRCGEKPVCGGFNNKCVAVEMAVKEVAHDPDSVEVKDCTPPKLTDDNCWVTRCVVRRKNALGVMVREEKTFSISETGLQQMK